MESLTLMEVKMKPDLTSEHFEEVYPRHEFAPLVRIALVLAERIKRIKNSKNRRVSEASDHQPAGPSHAH
jgi:hypothetical protein